MDRLTLRGDSTLGIVVRSKEKYTPKVALHESRIANGGKEGCISKLNAVMYGAEHWG
jgi:hypothetical protein